MSGVKYQMLNVKKRGFTPRLFNKKGKGFTLVELLVVIGIISTLSIIAAVSFQSAQKNARDQQRKSDLTQIQLALETFFLRSNRYPY